MDFSLRAWKQSDLEYLVKFANNQNIARYLTNLFPYPYTEADGIAFIEKANKNNPLQVFAIDIEGISVGGIGIHPQTDILCRNAELGYWLAEPYWKKGIATAAVKEMIVYGFAHFDIDRIFARPFGNNPASQRVLEKSGFILEARLEKTIYKFGQHIDELIYAIRKINYTK